jgi:amphi-Trp domain-containing protein
MASQFLKIKSKVALCEIVQHLEALVASLKAGQLCIRKQDETIVLSPQDPILLELEAEAKLEKEGLREKLVFELKWKKGEPAVEEGCAFSISSAEPIPEA